MTQFPYGNNLSKVSEWIGRWDTPFNSWYVQNLGGAASLDDLCNEAGRTHSMTESARPIVKAVGCRSGSI